MAYSATYTTSDLSPVVIDFLVSAGAAMVGFATIIGLAILWNLARGKKWNGRLK